MSTAIKDVVSSPRGQAALHRAGYRTLEECELATLDELATIKGVGEVTLGELQSALDLPTPVVEEAVIEEGSHPIHLDSPYGLHIRITEGTEERIGRRIKVHNPIFLQFDGGRAQLTRELYFEYKYFGDRPSARNAVKNKEPWRVEAAAWLKDKPSYKAGRFIILTD